MIGATCQIREDRPDADVICGRPAAGLDSLAVTVCRECGEDRIRDAGLGVWWTDGTSIAAEAVRS